MSAIEVEADEIRNRNKCGCEIQEENPMFNHRIKKDVKKSSLAKAKGRLSPKTIIKKRSSAKN